jgi:RHS repeat-associated protein
MLRAISVAGATPTMTYYFGPFVHEGLQGGTSSLKYIMTPEGRIINTGTDNSPIWSWEYNLTDHLGNVRVVLGDSTVAGYAKVLQQNHYYPGGMRMSQISTSRVTTNDYMYNGKQLQDDFGLNWYDYGKRFYDPALGRWNSVDPKATQSFSWSPYVYVENNPLKFIDPNGKRRWPVQDTYKGQNPRIEPDGWYGPRNIPNGSKFHKGLDINFGSGSFDYGAPALATHDGKVVGIHETSDGSSGRYIVIQSPDGTFQTSYLHLSDVDVEIGQNIKEGDEIGKVGGSGFGKNLGYGSHMHYSIRVKNAKTGKFDPFNPTEGKGNKNSNIVDPQTWISNNDQGQNMSLDFNILMIGQTTEVQDNTMINNIAFIQKVNSLPAGKYKLINGSIIPE